MSPQRATCLSIANASVAHADDWSARADALFAEGKELNGEGKYDEIRKRFAEAYGLKPSADIACNLGSTEVYLKNFVAGAEHLDVRLRITSET